MIRNDQNIQTKYSKTCLVKKIFSLQIKLGYQFE